MEKQKNIPVLRFPEFTGEWIINEMGDITKISSGGTPSRTNPDFWDGNIPWVSTSLIDFNTIFEASEYITSEGLKNSSAKLFPIGTLLMALYGQGKTRGKVALLGIEATTNQACGAITPNTETINEVFLFQNLAGRYDEIRNLSNQGGQENLSGELIKRLNIIFPTLPEQSKIATFLTAIDDRLNQLKQKKTLLEQYKNGVMQKIFDQEIRFKDDDGNEYPDWELKNLGEISTITTGSSNREDSTLEGNYTFFDRSQDIRSSSIFLFDGEAIIVAGEGQEFIPKYFIGKFDLHQRTYSIMNFVNANGKFLFYQIDKLRHYFFSQAVGSTVKSLRLPMFERMPIQLPSIVEQTKIANFLTAIDEKINGCNNQISKTEQYKTGLLQQLFV